MRRQLYHRVSRVLSDIALPARGRDADPYILEKQKEQNFFLMLCVVILFLYFAIGICFYTLVDNIPALHAVYFCVVTLVTIGYGDVLPQSNASKLFTCFFIFAGLAITTSAISWILAWLATENELTRTRKVQAALECEANIIKSFRSMPSDVYNEIEEKVDRENRDEFRSTILQSKSYVYKIMWDLFVATSIIILNIGFGTLFYGYLIDKYNLVDAIYLATVTVTSVGYGDVVPSNRDAMIFTIFYAFFGTLVTGSALAVFNSALSVFWVAREEEREFNRELKCDQIIAMDRDGSQSVSRDEFILYKLVRLGVVDEDLIRKAEDQFNRLDKDRSGNLTVDDIVEFSNICVSHKKRSMMPLVFMGSSPSENSLKQNSSTKKVVPMKSFSNFQEDNDKSERENV